GDAELGEILRGCWVRRGLRAPYAFSLGLACQKRYFERRTERASRRALQPIGSHVVTVISPDGVVSLHTDDECMQPAIRHSESARSGRHLCGVPEPASPGDT